MSVPEIKAIRTIARSRFFHIEELDLRFSNGVERTYERMPGSGRAAVIVVAVDESGDLLLIREYAAGFHEMQLTLVKGDLRGIATARALSVATVANMKQNLGFAFIYNMLGVPLAAGVLFPFTGWLLSPMIGALAMSLSSVSVIGNALRLRITTVKTE